MVAYVPAPLVDYAKTLVDALTPLASVTEIRCHVMEYKDGSIGKTNEKTDKKAKYMYELCLTVESVPEGFELVGSIGGSCYAIVSRRMIANFCMILCFKCDKEIREVDEPSDWKRCEYCPECLAEHIRQTIGGIDASV